MKNETRSNHQITSLSSNLSRCDDGVLQQPTGRLSKEENCKREAFLSIRIQGSRLVVQFNRLTYMNRVWDWTNVIYLQERAKRVCGKGSKGK